MKKKSLIIIICAILFLASFASAGPPVFEKVKKIALTGKQSDAHPTCWFWERQIAKDSIDLIFIIGYCTNDKSFLMAITEGPKTIALVFNGEEYAIFLFMFGQVVDVTRLTEGKAIEYAEKYFSELGSLGLYEMKEIHYLRND